MSLLADTPTGISKSSNLLTTLILISLTCGLVAVIARDGRRCTPGALCRTRLRGLILALTTLPTRAVWRQCLTVAALYALVAALLGLLTGFLRPALIAGSWRKFIVVPGLLLIQPGLVEELIYRVLLLPHPREQQAAGRTLLGAATSLIIFVLAHPLNGLTVAPAARALFCDLAFLLQAALLGLACTIAYLISGSIWPPVLIHWLPVAIWILFFGGARRGARSELFSSL